VTPPLPLTKANLDGLPLPEGIHD
ncbi:MAG: hypothetical protein JWN80_2556, partial [Microbacteriaceae bacterium]|nr:hypothetical protein [Microbacteriaceae bacterium]